MCRELLHLFCDLEAVVFSRTGVHGICVRVIMGDIIDCDRSVQSNKLLYIIPHHMMGLNHQYQVQFFMPVSFFLKQSESLPCNIHKFDDDECYEWLWWLWCTGHIFTGIKPLNPLAGSPGRAQCNPGPCRRQQKQQSGDKTDFWRNQVGHFSFLYFDLLFQYHIRILCQCERWPKAQTLDKYLTGFKLSNPTKFFGH